MEKSLLDILLDEREAVKSVNKIQYDIEYKREYYSYISNMFPDCVAKEEDLDRITEEIAKLQDDKIEAEENLADIRRRLAGYLNYLL